MWIRMSLAALLAAATLTGCVTSETCVSWVDFETPQDAYDDARLVVRGEVGAITGTRAVLGVQATVHAVTVVEVLKGDDPGSTIEVASTPITCTGGELYPDGDPLDVTGDVILFLGDPPDTHGWRLITPFDGVLPAPADGTLPFEVAD